MQAPLTGSLIETEAAEIGAVRSGAVPVVPEVLVEATGVTDTHLPTARSDSAALTTSVILVEVV